MSNERIQAALREATDTKCVVIGAGVVQSIDAVFSDSFHDQPAMLIADDNTYEVAGKQVQQRLEAAGRTLAEHYVFPGRPTLHADYGNIERLRETLRTHDAIPVAVGSGTLNDIVKRASHECDRPYMVVGTAASVDGYSSFGATITKEGYKQTMPCPAPRGVLADLDILARAPSRMTASGYADLLGKVPAGADWLIADALKVEELHPAAWSLVQEPLREAIARPAEVHAGDSEAIHGLIEGLIMSGLAMQAAASSRPASGTEHLFSHLWEMEGLGQGDDPPLSHGFKVGVGSVSIAALYERILERDLTKLDIAAICSAWPTREEMQQAVGAAHTTPGLAEAAVKSTLAKYVDAQQLAQRLELVSERWPAMRQRLQEQLLPAEEGRDMLRTAGCPTGPSEIGLNDAEFKETYYRARMIRPRYVVLDFATEAGILSECVDELFAPGGFWARDAAARGSDGR
jgi:glycerol-1-phosphate dehydrogenase [NAD(P)+]